MKYINFFLLWGTNCVSALCAVIDTDYCLSKPRFPVYWKSGLVLPLPKTEAPSDYRIVYHNYTSKILDRILKQQLKEHLNSNELIPHTQWGFRKKHSGGTSLLNLTHEIPKELDDYSKASDMLNQRLFLQYCIIWA